MKWYKHSMGIPDIEQQNMQNTENTEQKINHDVTNKKIILKKEVMQIAEWKHHVTMVIESLSYLIFTSVINFILFMKTLDY